MGKVMCTGQRPERLELVTIEGQRQSVTHQMKRIFNKRQYYGTQSRPPMEKSDLDPTLSSSNSSFHFSAPHHSEDRWGTSTTTFSAELEQGCFALTIE